MLDRRSYQFAPEMNIFVSVLRAECVTSYLEIGSKFGGSLRTVGRSLPKSSRIVSVDLCRHGGDLPDCVHELNQVGQVATLISGNSADPAVVSRVAAHAPFDAIFVDGDHTLEGVTADWENYGKMGRVVAFHDISWSRPPGWEGHRIHVPEFWNAVKGDFPHMEIRLDRGNNGIGVLWRGE